MTGCSTPQASGAIDDARWAAVLDRAATDDRFVYAVKTTGVYCRVGCASRRPLRKNVEFFESGRSAAAAGYRACQRCCPDRMPDCARRISEVCAMIQNSTGVPAMRTLADHAGLSVSRFQRVFKDQLGITPKQYADEVRAGRMRQALADGASVTTAMNQTGFNSPARLYEQSDLLLGMKPSNYRRGGATETIHYVATETSLGLAMIARTGIGVCYIAFDDNVDALHADLKHRFSRARLEPADDFEAQWIKQVVHGIDHHNGAFEVPLDIRGTAFMRQVWRALCEIPIGETRTYSGVAEAIGNPQAVRAVASACARNSIAVSIPCHRVIRRDGGLGGYRWGLKRKKQLLARENVHVDKE